jgi:YggT family protein
MLGQIATFLVDTLFTLFIYLLLARFHFQWLRVPFRNPVGEFLVAATNWMVLPARRAIPGLAGLDLATLLLAWIVEMARLWIIAAIAGASPGALPIALVALVALVRYSLYILIFSLFVQVAFSWINPDAPMAPIFDAVTRPFLRPLRRFIPPVGRVDITPLVLLLILYVLLFPLDRVQRLAAGL